MDKKNLPRVTPLDVCFTYYQMLQRSLVPIAPSSTKGTTIRQTSGLVSKQLETYKLIAQGEGVAGQSLLNSLLC